MVKVAIGLSCKPYTKGLGFRPERLGKGGHEVSDSGLKLPEALAYRSQHLS